MKKDFTLNGSNEADKLFVRDGRINFLSETRSVSVSTSHSDVVLTDKDLVRDKGTLKVFTFGAKDPIITFQGALSDLESLFKV